MMYDSENLLFDIKALLVANFNTYIDTKEAEKVSQGLPATNLAHVDTTNGYFEQNWSDKILNMNPALFYGIDSIVAEGIGPTAKQMYKIFVEVIFVDTQVDALSTQRVHRYTNALLDLFKANYDQIRSMSRIKIEALKPVSQMLELNSSESVKIGGVLLTTALG